MYPARMKIHHLHLFYQIDYSLVNAEPKQFSLLKLNPLMMSFPIFDAMHVLLQFPLPG